MNFEQDVTDRFRLEDPELTPEVISKIYDNWGIDTYSLERQDIILLANFVLHGASAAMMDFIVRTKDKQEPTNEHPLHVNSD